MISRSVSENSDRRVVLRGGWAGELAAGPFSGASLRRRQALGACLLAAEMIGAERGIGALILAAGHLLQTDRLLAGVLVLSLLGLLISGLIARLETWLLRWR